MCSYQMTPVIASQRLRLRPLQAADAPRIAQYANDIDVARMTARMPFPYSLQDAEGFIASLEDPTSREKAVFGIDSPDDGLVGVVGFHQDDGSPLPAIGYWLGRRWWGAGFATEATRAALKWAKDHWGKKAILGGHFADNPASGAVLVKSGFLYTGDVQPRHSLARGAVAPLRWMVWLA